MVSTSLAAVGTWANGLNLQGTIAGVDIAARRDQEGWSNPLQNVYTSKDERHILIALQNIPRDFPKLIDVLERPEWRDEPDMHPIKPLFKNRFEARRLIAAAFAELDAQVICQRLDEVGIVYSLIYRNAEVLEDEQILTNDVIVPFDSGKPGCERTFATPFAMSSESQIAPQRAPEIGEHTDELLAEFGVAPERIAELREHGVINK